MTGDRDNIRHHALRNALYHAARRRFFEFWSKACNFVVLLLGTGVVAEVAVKAEWVGIALGLAVAVISGLQLVYNFAGMARLHENLHDAYSVLLAEVEADPEGDAGRCAGWVSRMTLLGAKEPPIKRAADARAHNDAIDALGIYASGERIHIGALHRWLAHVASFEGVHFQTVSERAGGKA